MKWIPTEEAVGSVLCHDITQIIPGIIKDARFRKGHIVKPEDIPVLLSLGKEHLYVWEAQPNMLHENDAAEILCSLCKNTGMLCSEVKEGKIELKAEYTGLFQVNREKLKQINSLGEMMIATRHSNTVVHPGDKLAGTRIIPLVIKKEKMEKAKAVVGEEPILKITPFEKKKAVILTIGNEVYRGRIDDAFTPVVKNKLKAFDIPILDHQVLPDENALVTHAIQKAITETGAEFVICTGGMSVDPDDRTPLAIRNTGAEVISYGSPVLPGAMFMLAYEKEKRIPIVGLPGCVMYAKRTIFDLVLPHILANDRITAEELASLGEGGLCLGCDICTYPNCGFGKGW